MKYSVLLYRPDYMTDGNGLDDTFYTFVTARSAGKAVDAARASALNFDGQPKDAEYDYKVMLVTKGHNLDLTDDGRDNP